MTEEDKDNFEARIVKKIHDLENKLRKIDNQLNAYLDKIEDLEVDIMKYEEMFDVKAPKWKMKKVKTKSKKTMTSYDFTFRVLLLGDPSSGKEELVNRYIAGYLVNDNKLTIGVDFYSKTLEVYGRKVKLQIWDFGGEERFRFLLHQYCKGKNAAMIMYDITNRLSLVRLPDWTQIIREHAGDIPIMLIGNRIELEKSRAVSKEEGILLAEKYNLSAYMEMSSKTGQNVEKAFEVITEILIERFS